MVQIITHRGLDPSKKNYFPESTYEAFADHLKRGYGIEFDLEFTADGEMVVFHAPTLKNFSRGQNADPVSTFSAAAIKKMRWRGCRLCFLPELIPMIAESKAPLAALHLKGKFQIKKHLARLVKILSGLAAGRLLIFDLKPETATFFKAANPGFQLAPSVAHPYDIVRYNQAVGGTLLSLNTAAASRHLFSWVWLDEWDRKGEKRQKKFYTKKTFAACRREGFQIGLVTPELHATSPGLLAGEAHADAYDQKRLFRRIREIISLNPDAICTDYPDQVKALLA